MTPSLHFHVDKTPFGALRPFIFFSDFYASLSLLFPLLLSRWTWRTGGVLYLDSECNHSAVEGKRHTPRVCMNTAVKKKKASMESSNQRREEKVKGGKRWSICNITLIIHQIWFEKEKTHCGMQEWGRRCNFCCLLLHCFTVGFYPGTKEPTVPYLFFFVISISSLRDFLKPLLNGSFTVGQQEQTSNNFFSGSQQISLWDN